MSSKRLLDRVSRGFSKGSKASTSKESYISDGTSSKNSLSVSSKGNLSIWSAKTHESFTSIGEEMSLGLDVLWDGGEDAIVDIVAIHGLNGHRERTWTASNGVNWLRDLLPNDIPKARIMSYGYNVNVFDHNGHGLDQQSVYDHARTLISDLVFKRQLTETERRPILFVVHSLGGIVLKAALIHSDSCRIGSLESHHAISTSTHGIIFMGVPHQGGNGVALGKMLVNIASSVTKADTRIMKDLERDSQLLSTQLGQYQAISGQFVTKFAYETLETKTAFGHTLMIVPMSSAVVPGAVDAEPIAIAADHRNMIRFRSENDLGYQKISGHMRLMLKTAATKVENNWRIDDAKRRVEFGNAKKNSIIRLKDITSPFFTGRQEESNLLRQYLNSDTEARHVVVWGAAGCGKTAIAVNYALEYSNEFSAIFLVSAKDTETMRKDYGDIASHLGLSEAVPEGEVDVAKQDAAIKAVKRWFTDHEGGDWLLIIDNADDLAREVTVKNDEESNEKKQASAGVDVQDYIPPTRKGHIIMTSQDRRAASFSPYSIELADMKQSDAEELFLKKAKLSNPTSEQLEATLKIVEKLGCLALAVDHAGSYVHDNDMANRLPEYIKQLEESVTKVLGNKNAPMFSLHKTSVLATVTMARDSIKNQNMRAAHLLHLLGVLDGTSVSESFLRSESTVTLMKQYGQNFRYDENYSDCIKVLVSFSLIRVHLSEDGTAIISMHGLVHTCLCGIMTQENQWRWIARSMQILKAVGTEKFFDGSYFAHLRFIMRMISRRQKAMKEIGKAPQGLYTIAAVVLLEQQERWRQRGMMMELFEFGCMVYDGLENEDVKGEGEIAAVNLALNVKLLAVSYTNDPKRMDQYLREHLIKYMHPDAAKIVDDIEGGRKTLKAFKFSSMDEVFTNCQAHALMATLYSGYTIEVAKAFIGRDDPDSSEVWFHISRLPPTGDLRARMQRLWILFLTWMYALWTGEPTTADWETKMVQASRDRIAGNITSTMSLLREMALGPVPPDKEEQKQMHQSRATYDLVKLLLKGGRVSEASDLLNKFETEQCKCCSSEMDVWEKWTDMYLWARKMHIEVLKVAGHEGGYHERALFVLNKMLETIQKATGEKSLGAVHVHMMLQMFYLQPCCFDGVKSEEHRLKAIEGYNLMFCGSKRRVREGEGFRMGKILMAQGSLEEAVYDLRMSLDASIRELGNDDPLTLEIARICAIAERELDDEKEEIRRGIASMRWGSCTFWRDVSEL